jgi:DNA helicase-2/ATP-dependent DNA helicase PcrA
VLTRRNADIAPLYAELTARDVPVEIVGLGGLLHLPEVMDTLATLRLVDDVTANPDLLRLLSGPRWHVGPRDLALLGRRARELARDHQAQVDEGEGDALLLALEQAVADVDPTEVVCLLDALESPGDAGYSAEALSRFRRLAGELGGLRAHADEPLLDLTRRVLVTLGLDVELMATPEFNRTARRDQIGAFLDAVADYVDVDGDASLTGLLSYFQAEVDQGAGLDQAVPSDREAVKLLTVHKAKGLEWEVVFLPALMKGVFPSDRVTDNWVTTPAALPAELRGDSASIPQLAEATNNAMSDYKRQLSAEQLMAEDRLAYVAVTRAKQLLVGSGHWWRRDLTNPRVTSTYLRSILAEAAEQGQLVAEAAPPAAANPLVSESVPRPWPQPLDPAALTLRQGAAAMVQQARERRTRTGSYEPAADAQEQLLLDGEETVAGWDADIERLVAEVLQARSGRQLVELPSTLSATAMLRLAEDPDAFAAELARPMPRPPSRAARFGTRFHQWVEHHFAGGLTSGRVGQQQLVDPDELADRADAGAHGEAELRELCQQFAAGQFGETVPYAVEAPFTLLLAGRLIRGRIDAVYELGGDEPGGDEPGVDEPGVDELSGDELSGDQRRQLTGWRYRVVDWKTNQSDTADPLQLAVYRLAWAEICSLPVDQVDAVFYYVRQDRVVRPSRLPDRAELEGLLRDP